MTIPAHAGSHTWRFNEVFSSADGTVQFIEMKECCGGNGETFIGNKDVSSKATGNSFVFPGNLSCCTGDAHLLLATPAFAALPGAPEPDYIIEPEFFDAVADTLTYYLYGAATWSFANVPTDGVNALTRLDGVQVNSPTNFDGDRGSVIVPCHPADVDGNGAIDSDDLVAVILAWGPNPGDPSDIDNNGVVDVDDLLEVILNWGGC